MTNFADRLVSAIGAKRSAAVVGLDPRFELIPDEIRNSPAANSSDVLSSCAQALLSFNQEVIDIVYPHVAMVKPQVAFYERFGPPGIAAFRDTITYARSKGLLVLTDIKRGDIGSTAAAYAEAHLGFVEVNGKLIEPFGADAVTVNPYLGTDGIEPFLGVCEKHGKGIFVLVRTSNPSGAEFQNLLVDGEPFYRRVAKHVEEWGKALIGDSGYSSVGAVVGGTCPKEASEIRALLPKTYFLVPGYGAQGGEADDVSVSFNKDGLGAVVNSSRGIIHAYTMSPWKERFGPERWREAVAAAIEHMNQELSAVIPHT